MRYKIEETCTTPRLEVGTFIQGDRSRRYTAYIIIKADSEDGIYALMDISNLTIVYWGDNIQEMVKEYCKNYTILTQEGYITLAKEV